MNPCGQQVEAWPVAPESAAERPFRQTQLICHELDGEALLYDPQRDITHRLNATALFIWRACDGRHGFDEIAEQLTEVFDVEIPTARADVSKAIRQMRANQLIE